MAPRLFRLETTIGSPTQCELLRYQLVEAPCVGRRTAMTVGSIRNVFQFITGMITKCQQWGEICHDTLLLYTSGRGRVHSDDTGEPS